MTYEEAKHLLLIHSSGIYDDAGNYLGLHDGFLMLLRPYRGLREENFHVVMEAILTVGEQFHVADSVERKLIGSLWSTSRLMRLWGLHPHGMLQRNYLITAEDTQKLEKWVDSVEKTILGLLNGCPPYYQVIYAEYLIEFGPSDNSRFFYSVDATIHRRPRTH